MSSPSSNPNIDLALRYLPPRSRPAPPALISRPSSIRRWSRSSIRTGSSRPAPGAISRGLGVGGEGAARGEGPTLPGAARGGEGRRRGRGARLERDAQGGARRHAAGRGDARGVRDLPPLPARGASCRRQLRLLPHSPASPRCAADRTLTAGAAWVELSQGGPTLSIDQEQDHLPPLHPGSVQRRRSTRSARSSRRTFSMIRPGHAAGAGRDRSRRHRMFRTAFHDLVIEIDELVAEETRLPPERRRAVRIGPIDGCSGDGQVFVSTFFISQAYQAQLAERRTMTSSIKGIGNGLDELIVWADSIFAASAQRTIEPRSRKLIAIL